MIALFKSLAPIERTLDYQAERQTVLGSNIANLNTPGFTAQDLAATQTDDGQLELQRTNAAHNSHAHSDGQNGQLVRDESTPAGRDGNNVSLEREMSKIMASSLRYDAAAEIISRRLAMLRYAASDGVG